MREVILTVGTRASGKSTFCEAAVALEPSIVVVSRDQILIQLFGKTHLSTYSGGHYLALERMWEAVERELEAGSVKMILDVWSGSQRERRSIIEKLRQLGAERVVAWYFITPISAVEQWFWRKPGVAKIAEMKTRQGEGLTFYSEGAPRRDYKLYQQEAAYIDSDGFDEVVRINPLFARPVDVLPFQASFSF